jgi:hypothetical protein
MAAGVPLTLTITIAAPWYTWQCSDHRVTYLKRKPNGQWHVDHREDDSVKHLLLRCKDGAALLTYTGLAKVGDDHISHWLRRQVRGSSRTLDETLIRIREAATADLARPAKAASRPHAFAVGAYLQQRPWAVGITNTTGPPDFPILDEFTTEAVPADEPKVMILGEGSEAVSDEDWTLLLRVAQRRPRRPEDYAQLLANVHRRTKHSNHPKRHTISEGCITSFIPPSGDGGQTRTHWGQPGQDTRLLPVPTVGFGIDLTETGRVMVDWMRAAEAGRPMDDAEYQRRLEEAGRRSVQPPKP